MAKGFNLTAELNLRGPANVRQVVSNINKQLKNIKGTVNLTIDPNSAKSIAQVNKNLVQLQKNLNNVRSSARAVSSNLSGIGKQFNNISTAATKAATTTQNAAKNINSVGQQSQAAANQIGKAGTLMESFGKQSALAVKRFAAFSLVTSTVFSLTNAVNQAFKQFVEFDRQLVRLQQVTGKTAAGLKGISQEISNLSQSLGVSSSDLISVSTTLAQAGLSARETEKALKALALSALAPSFDDLNRTVEGSIALMRQFGISAGDLEKALGSVNAVAANFAVEAGDIIAAIQRTGGVFAAASRGVSEGTDALNEFVAVFTSVRATTRESAETIATGLRTIFTRIQRGSTIDALREFGVELQDAEGKFVGAYKAIQLLSQGLNQLDPRDVKFSTLVEELGGFRQIGKVIPLIQQFATAQQALAVAQRGQGSLAEDAATAQLSLANQIAKVREEFLDLIREIGGTDSFRAITKGALDLASALIQIADSVKGVLPVLGVLLAGKGLKAGFGFTKGFLGGLKGQADGGLIKPYASGGMVDVALMPGETVISPKLAKKIGMSTLDRMNKADKMASGGLAKVPGSGRRDSFYTQLEEGSYVIRTDATKAMGDGTIKDIASGRRKFADGGLNKPIEQGKQTGGVGIFDSDMIGAGSKQLLAALRSSGKSYSVVSGPAGSGKTTFATRRYGKNFVRTPADIERYSKFVVLSGAGATKTGDFSTDAKSLMSGASQVVALQPSSEQVMQQREQRIANAEKSGLPDSRSMKQLQGTMKAPTSIDQNLYKSFGNVKFVKRFADGGIVEDLKRGKLTVGAAILERDKGYGPEPLGITKQQIQSQLNKDYKLSSSFPSKIAGNISLQRKGLSESTYNSFDQALDTSLVSAVNMAGSRVAQDLGTSFTSINESMAQGFLKGINTGSRGNLFEDVLLAMTGGPFEERSAGQNFDFPNGLKGILSDDYSGLPSKWVDAKASFAAAQPAGMTKKTVNEILSDVRANSKLYMERKQGVEPEEEQDVDKPERAYSLTQLRKTLNQPNLSAQEAARKYRKSGANYYARLASGGEVPIMAQEGEYVINKKSARSIGYGNLNRLNKYHDGGMVQKFKFGGDVQKLANGGPTVSQQIGSLGLPSGISGKLKSAFERLIDESRGLISGFSATEAQMHEYNASMRMIERASKPLADSIRLNNDLNQRTGRQQIRIAKEVERQIALTMNSNTHTTTHAQRLAKLNRQIVKKVAIIDQENARVAKTGTLYSKIDAGYEKLKASVAKLTASTKRAATRMLGMNMPSDPAWKQKGLSGKPVRGGGGFGTGGGTTAIAIALPLLADAFSSSAEATDAATASTQAFVQSLTTTAGVGLLVSDTLGDMAGKIPGVGAALGPLVSGIGLAATAAFSIAKAYADASEAARKFTIEDAKKKVETEAENIAKLLEEIDKTGRALPDTLARLDSALAIGTTAVLQAADANSRQYRASVLQNTLEVGTNYAPDSKQGTSQVNRSIILQEKGTLAYLRSLGNANVEIDYMTRLLPKLAKESSSLFKDQAKNIEDVLVAKLKTGQSIEDIMGTAEWSKQAEVIARSNTEVEKQIQAIQSNISLTEDEKNKRKENIIAIEANRVAQEKIKQVALEKNLAALANASNKLVYSFNRILSNMEDAVSRATSELNSLEAGASDLRASLSGQASSAGTPQLDRLISVLESPRGFNAGERSAAFSTATQAFGGSAGNISQILEVGATLEDTVLKTINRISANAAPGTTNEAIGGQVSSAISKSLANIGLPPELSNKLAKEIGNQVSKLRTSGDDQIDFSEIVEQVPGLGKALESVKTATNAVTSNLKFLQTAFQKLSASTNTLIELQIDSNNRFLRSQQIIIDGYANLAQALGKNLSLTQKRYAIESQITARTGGTTDPTQIRRNITGLSNQKQNLEEGKAAAQAAQDTDAVLEFERQIQKTSVSLNENVAALQNMAENTDLASAALSTLQQAQEKQRAGIGIIEKLVTSTPKQLNELNNSAIRLSRNMAGGLNFGTSPEQRQQDLELFNMIAPLLGDQAEPLKANVLQSMLQQSGVGITPMFQQILDTMRNPQADPVQAQAIKTYNEAIQKQSDANTQLALINQNLANDISQKTGAAIAAAIAQTTVRFDEAQLKDILSGTNRPDLDKPEAAPPFASGGLIYKAVGGNVANTVFKPKGTDTVPAMLTPGEFVVNRDSTRKNLPLLKSINSGKSSSTRYYSSGGLVANNIIDKKGLKDREEKESNVRVSNDPLPVLDPRFLESGPNSISNVYATKTPYHPIYAQNKSLMGDVFQKAQAGPLLEWAEEAGLIGNLLGFTPWRFLVAAVGAAARAQKIAKFLDIYTSNSVDLNKGITGWSAGRPSTISHTPSKYLANGPGSFEAQMLADVALSGLMGASFVDTLGKNMYPEFTLNAPNVGANFSSTPIARNIPFPVDSIIQGATPQSAFSDKPLRLNNRGAASSYDLSASDTDPEKSVATQIKFIKELLDKFKAATVDTNITADSFADGKDLKANEAKFDNLMKFPDALSLPPIIDPVATPLDNSLFNSLAVFGQGVSDAPAISSASDKTVSATRNDLVAGSADILAPGLSSSQADAATVLGALSKRDIFIQNLKSKLNLLRKYKDNDDNFKTLTTGNITKNILENKLNNIANDSLPKLYETIDSKYLNTKWKNNTIDGLHVFKSTLKTDWKKRVIDQMGKNQDLLESIYTGSNDVVEIGSKQYPWVGDASLIDQVLKNYGGTGGELETAARQALAQSDFKVGETVQAGPFPLEVNASDLMKGLPKKPLQLAFSYKTVDMPKYTQRTGYTEAEGNLKGILPAMSDKIDPFTVDPMRIAPGEQSLTREGEKLFYEGDPQVAAQSFADELKGYYNKLKSAYSIDDQVFNSAPVFSGASSKYVKNISQALAAAGISDPNGQGLEIVGGSANANLAYTLIQARDKILSQVGSEISRGETADLTKDVDGKSVFDDLRTAQSIVKAVVGPVTGALRYAGIAFPNISDIANLAEYGAGLIRAGDTVGGFARSGRDNFANAYGQLKSLGEIFSAFGSGNEAFGLAKLGISEYTPDRRGDISPINIENARSAVSAIRDYGRFLTEQGALFMGGNAAAVDQTVDSNLTVGGQTIAEIFKSGKVQLAEVDAQAGTFSSSQASEAQAPKTFKDIGKMVLNPYSVFPGETRKNLTTPLNNVLSQNGYQRIVPLIQGITDYLTLQDKFLSDPNNPANPAAGDADLNKLNRDLLLLTGGVLGAIPNKDKLDQLKAARSQQQKAQQPQTRARGGLIYAANGTLVNFQPQGTDTVPAMLTPGEFVINRKATQKHLPLLKAINNSGPSGVSAGDMVQKFAYGGVVQPKYYADAGPVTGSNRAGSIKPAQAEINKQSISAARTAISEALSTGATAVASVLESISLSENSISAIASFTNSVRDIINGLSGISIPSQIQFTGNVQVNLTGATGLTQAAESIVDSAIKKAFGDLGLANEGSIVIPQRYK